MKKSIFNYNEFLEPICKLLTNHKHCKYIGCTQDFIDRGYKYPNRSDFYYKCKICGYVFFNHKISKEDLEKLKRGEL